MSDKRSPEFVGDDFMGGDEESDQEEGIENDDGSESDSGENGETSCKQVKRELVDRLSSLPEPLLIDILDRLGMKIAVATSVLSKRWKCLWAEMPRLEFSETSSKMEKISKFVTRVDRAISLRTVNSLGTFDIGFYYNKCFVHNVNAWVGFAVQCKVKILSLELNLSGDAFYTLPQEIYSCSSLTRLSLQGCTVEPHGSINWKYLTALLIEESELSEETIQKILSACQDLHSLDLRDCWGFECLHIDSKSLDNLSIEECEIDDVKGSLLEISAPYLRYLYITNFSIDIKELRIQNIESLVRVQINFTDSDSSLEVMYNVMELFRSIHHVKVLEIGGTLVKILSDMVVTGLQFPQSRRDSLILEARRDDRISGILALLESSPYLETLVVHCYDDYQDNCTKSFGPVAKDDLDCDLMRLKTVQLLDYADPNWAGEPMLTLARVLLKRAKVLETMVVDADGNLTKRSRRHASKIGQTLLSYPKSSQNATITFSP